MIRYVSLWFLMQLVVSTANAQVISIYDETSGAPLPGVSIIVSQNELSFYTDSLGQANWPQEVKSGLIRFSLDGYRAVTLPYEDLTHRNFRIGLTPVSTLLEEAVVSSYRQGSRRNTTIHIEPLSLTTTENLASFNLSDALAGVSGVDQLSTGTGISKPVVRGLYGSRVLVLLSGLRFDNQQWQDEHGLGLSGLGIGRVELIKGPLSVLYGTGAVGGVVNLVEESAPDSGMVLSDVRTTLHSNTLGGSVSGGIRANSGSRWYCILASVTNHADYADGNNSRVLNSRFNGYELRASLGFRKGKWRSDNHYQFSYNNFGFIFNDISNFMEPDARWSRSMNGPHHIVMLNILSSVNTLRLKNSVLRLNVGLQSNLRSEDEGGGELSLMMHLVTGQYALKWQKQFNRSTSLVLANNTLFESNVNYGRRKIVPDATMAESAVSGYLSHELNKLLLEAGLGGGFRFIKTLLTSTVNSLEKDIDPFSQQRWFGNFLAGVNYFPVQQVSLRFNLASGVRAPNLAELSANGLHEGIYTYEIGDPSMDNERNINAELGLSLNRKTVSLHWDGFVNRFADYIYLDPTNEEWFGFPVYRFRQANALIYGMEAGMDLKPARVKGLSLSADASGLVGLLAEGEYLPYMPAWKLKPGIRLERGNADGLRWSVFISWQWVMSQERLAAEELPTPSYQLANAGAGFSWRSANARYSLDICGKNLLNQAYYDHLSRIKNYGLLNIGRDITLSFKVQFEHKLK